MKFVRSEKFKRCFASLPSEVQKIAEKKMFLLARNFRHPSLRVKKMEGTDDIWEASITMNYRVTFRIEKNELHLRVIGKHDEALKNP